MSRPFRAVINFVASFVGNFVAFVESDRESSREGAKGILTADCADWRRFEWDVSDQEMPHFVALSATLSPLIESKRLSGWMKRAV